MLDPDATILRPADARATPAPQPIDARRIETGRLVLRPPVYSDGPGLFALLSDPLACRFSPHPLVKDIAVTRFQIVEWREMWAQGMRTFVITPAERRRDPIGFLNIGADEQLGGLLSPRESGRGLASEALLATIDALSLGNMWTIIDAEHHALIHALDKAGIVLERRLPAHRVHPQISPRMRDCVLLRQQARR